MSNALSTGMNRSDPKSEKAPPSGDKIASGDFRSRFEGLSLILPDSTSKFPDMKFKHFNAVNMDATDGVGSCSVHAENCSLAGSKRCGGVSCIKVCMTVCEKSASSRERLR